MKCDSLECQNAAVIQLCGKAYCVRCANALGMQPAQVLSVLPMKPDYAAIKVALKDPLVAAVVKAREGDIERATAFIPKEPKGFRIEYVNRCEKCGEAVGSPCAPMVACPRCNAVVMIKPKSGIELDLPEGWNRDTPNGPHDD